MAFKVLIRKMHTEIPEVHYIHAENLRIAKEKIRMFNRPGILIREVQFIPTSDILVMEECGIFED